MHGMIFGTGKKESQMIFKNYYMNKMCEEVSSSSEQPPKHLV